MFLLAAFCLFVLLMQGKGQDLCSFYGNKRHIYKGMIKALNFAYNDITELKLLPYTTTKQLIIISTIGLLFPRCRR